MLVVMSKNLRNIDAEGARHAVVAVSAVYGRIGGHNARHILDELDLFRSQRLEAHESLEVVLKMLPVCHTA